MYYPRYLQERLEEAIKHSPIVLLIGPRQAGKTTLMREITANHGFTYVTFDNLKILAAARHDPIGFLENVKKPVIIDEIQRVPELALTIKEDIDIHRIPGRYALTGSANPLGAAQLNDSLAGRMIVLTLWPLSQTEIHRTKTSFLDRIFAEKWESFECLEWSRPTMIDTLLKGGFPPIHDASSKWRSEWCNSHLITILERDVQDITQVRRVDDLFLLMSLLSARSAQLLNIADIGRSSGIPYATLTNYLSLLESLFFIVRIPAWHANLTKRLTKMAKLYVADTAILSYLVEASATSLEKETTLLRHILESFVAIELKKLMSWHYKRLNLFHFRTESGIEVDFLLQDANGYIVGIEVKLNSTIRSDDFKGLEYLAGELKSKFLRGIVLYPGSDIVAFGTNMIALPISSLWAP